MIDLSIVLRLLLSLAIGVAIGLERESHGKIELSERQQKVPSFLGVRTFALITLLGSIAGLLIENFIGIFLLISITIMTLIISYYILNSIFSKDFGITSEIALIYSYLAGMLISLELLPIQLVIAIAVVLILILARKTDIKSIVSGIHREELNAFTSYALIALVILPFLPNQSYSVNSFPGFADFLSNTGLDLKKVSNIEILNPFRLWLIVALITGIGMAGYALDRIVGGKHGRLIASLIGGLVSSTATTQALAQESKTSKEQNHLAASAVFATLMSFFPIIVLIGSINPDFLLKVLPTIIAIIISAFITGIYFLKLGDQKGIKKDIRSNKKITESEIFSFGPALKFAFLFLVISIATQISTVVFGQGGFLATSSIAGLTGTDASTLNIATLAGDKVNFQTAVLAFILLNTVNLGAKSFYSFTQGKREFAVRFAFASLVIIAASLVGLITP